MTLEKQNQIFPVITSALQRTFENKAKDLPDTTPEICGYYGRACRQMDKEEGANRALCTDCPLAKYIKEVNDLELINRQSHKRLTFDDVFTFSVILCDNENDRDFEAFSGHSLKLLKKMFVGRTGMLSFDSRSEDNSARIYKIQLFTDPARKTSYGGDYKYLKAWSYIMKTPQNAEYIKRIKGEIINKRVGISCSIKKMNEITNEEVGISYGTKKESNTYNIKLCYKVLDHDTDTYEWFPVKPIDNKTIDIQEE